MGINFGKVFGGALKLLPLVIQAVGAVERLATGAKGKAKEDAAVDLVRDFLPLLEGAINRDVVDDAQVQAALRSAIQAIVALANVARDVQAKRAEAKALEALTADTDDGA